MGIPIQITIDQKQPENVEYFNCFGNMITHDARCTVEGCHGKSSLQQQEHSFHQKIGITFKEEAINCYIWSVALYGADSWTLGKLSEIPRKF